ncbi:MAG: AAA family ATPase [Fimbriimonadaceae bacterium]|nr:AAA family ATPase [Fimbriimonadaceae bacterium]
MILSNLSLVKFRGLLDIDLPDLAPVNLIVGSNNTGKTTILEAISLLLRPFDPTQWIQVARQRDADLPMVEGLWSLFPAAGMLAVEDGPKQTPPLKVSGTLDATERTMQASALASLSWESDRSDDMTLRVEAVVDDGRGNTKHDLVFRRDAPASFNQAVPAYRCFTVTPSTHRSSRAMALHLSHAVDYGNKSLAEEMLTLFDPEALSLDVSTAGGGSSVRVNHRTRGVADLTTFGDGMRRAVALSLALARASGGLLLIDELVATIHTGALGNLFERLVIAARDVDVQICATTHSLEAIDAFIAAAAAGSLDVASYRLRRRADRMEVKRYGPDQLAELREMGVDPR